ncbi:MAG: hypothetical protein PVG71_14540 [Anaerolineae bacterium]|jgi:hypothetical protein
MNHQERYLSYLLRMWQDSGGSPGGDPPLWRASLESPHNHTVQAFAGLDELFAFLREQVDMEPPQSGAAAGEEFIERGGSEMKKIIVVVVGVVVVLVAAVAVGSVLFTSGDAEPVAVEGSWAWEITSSQNVSQGDSFSMNGTDKGTWEGAFEGTSTGRWTYKGSAGGSRQYDETVSFVGSVEDETGTRRQGKLEIYFVGEQRDRNSDTVGTWEIIAGEGELEGCHGDGTSTSPSNVERTDYKGQIYFEAQPFWRFW